MYTNYDQIYHSLQGPQPTVVPLAVVVFLGDIELLLLRGIACRLLRRLGQPNRVPPLSSQIPQVHLLLHVRHRLRVVCAVTREALLHEAILPLRLDTRGPPNCGDAVLPDHPGVYVCAVGMKICATPK